METVWDFCYNITFTFIVDSFGFVAISSVLDKESFDLKVLANQLNKLFRYKTSL